MKTAKKIKSLEGFRGEAALYELSEPAEYAYNYETEEYECKTSYVAVSAITSALDTGRSETFIFPADKDGEVLSLHELKGSAMDTTSHAEVLNNAGYSCVN